jgi:transglutaminase-like putative cysteine protease
MEQKVATAVVYDIVHSTTYTYKAPVKFAQHRAMFLPRAGHGGRIDGYSITANVPISIRWIRDALSNSVALIDFPEPTQELVVTFKFRVVHYGAEGITECPVEPRAQQFPVQYTPDEWTDLVGFMRPHTDDLDGSVAAWARSFLSPAGNDTAKVLRQMMDTIRDTFQYQSREAEGTQRPGETLQKKSGTCRDFAWLMIESLRALGLACRYESGYLYDSSLDGGDAAMTGSASTHAWLTVFLPGAGWVHCDPTNRISGGFELIPVATTRHPAQAIPLQGSWFGAASDYVGMSVKVAIKKISGAAPAS